MLVMVVIKGVVAVAEGDEARTAESPIAATSNAAAATQLFRFDSNRRTPDVALDTGRSGTGSSGLAGS
jgi:hypothetical protein